MKKNYFWNSQKFSIREIRKTPHENPIFFLDKPCQTLFLLYTVIALLILKTEFGLIWKSHWPDEND